MVGAQGPAGSRRRLGAELRRLRTNAGMHLDQVAAAVPCSTSKISRLETGKGSPKLVDVRRLMEIYGVSSETESDMLLRLVHDSRGRGWWEPYTEGVTAERFILDDSNRYPALEADAVAVATFDVVFLHGLLQTAEYARAVIGALLPLHTTEEVDQLVALRLKRQEALTRRADPIRYSAVIDESVLQRAIGGPQVMAAQLRALQAAAGRPNVDLRVFPLAAGMHRAHAGRFAVLDFGAGLGSAVVYVEGPAGDSYLDAEGDVSLYQDVFADAAERALDASASIAMIARYLDVLAPRT